MRSPSRLKKISRSAAVMAWCVFVVAPSSGRQPSSLPIPERVLSPAATPSWLENSKTKLDGELVARYGETQRERLRRGLKQVAALWKKEDGDAGAFEEFVKANFAGDAATLDAMFARYDRLLESINGGMSRITLDLRAQSDLDAGKIYPFDEIFAGYDPSAHVIDDFFQNKSAFVVLLNFPVTTLEERLTQGRQWSRRQWAEARLAERFSKRIPADVQLAIAEAGSRAQQYIAEYNLWMHHVIDDRGRRLFKPKLRLLSHWNLRDEIKADYSEPETALAKQRIIEKVMERIVTQTIPASVINNPHVDWNPYTNAVALSTVNDSETPVPGDIQAASDPEPDRRYAALWGTYAAARKADPYSPAEPTLMARRFDEDREIPESRVREMLETVLSSPLAPKAARLIESRLGRRLEPFDIWYNGFSARGAYTEAQLDEIVSKKYPTADAYKADIPNLLMKLGFSKERAEYLAGNIVVEPARGSGHALGADMRSEKARLRTRVEKNGMNYKGFNIAVHEMGHNVEQTFSLNDIDYVLLHGVPNTAFTEALAFVFQGHDLELLGLASPDAKTKAMKTLHDFWMTYEIAGVALVDMQVWRWMYDHPDAAPAELKNATIEIAKGVWNKYYAPIFRRKDVVLLGIYSHMIDGFLYLPDYPIGHMIAFQVEEKMPDTARIGPEFERMAKMGSVAPDLWMVNATGAPVGPEALLKAAENALKVIRK